MEPLVKLVMDDALGYAMSARPHAPVAPDPPRRRSRGPGRVRRAAAGTLRRLADRLEPGRPAATPC